MTTFRFLLSATLVAVLGMASVPAQALVKWTFLNANCVSTPGTAGCNDTSRIYDASAANNGETPGTVTATGWANTAPGDTNNQLAQGLVPAFGSNGIGVINNDAGETGNSESSSNGQHSVDNVGRYDLVLFEFQDSVSVTEVGIGWFDSDADISLLAWVGGNVGDTPDITGVSYSGAAQGLTAVDVNGDPDPNGTGGLGWQLIGNFDVDTLAGGGSCPENSTTDCVQPVSTPVSSSYWIVAAYNPVFAGGPNEGPESTVYPDKVKILSLAGTIDTPAPPGNASLPAPGSLVLLLGGIVPMLRRRRRTA